jgi:hypothetical protein
MTGDSPFRKHQQRSKKKYPMLWLRMIDEGIESTENGKREVEFLGTNLTIFSNSN